MDHERRHRIVHFSHLNHVKRQVIVHFSQAQHLRGKDANDLIQFNAFEFRQTTAQTAITNINTFEQCV